MIGEQEEDDDTQLAHPPLTWRASDRAHSKRNPAGTPPVEHLAFHIGTGVLAAAEIIERPVAAVLAGSHLLIGLTHRPALRQLGEALAEG
jgi:hypothetical protein